MTSVLVPCHNENKKAKCTVTTRRHGRDTLTSLILPVDSCCWRGLLEARERGGGWVRANIQCNGQLGSERIVGRPLCSSFAPTG